ncbi:MAG: glycosyltransferase [Ktedonobacterales bacterium]
MRRIRVVEIVGNGEGGGTKCMARIASNLDPDTYEITVISPEAPWLADVCAQHGARYRTLPMLSSRLSPALYAELSTLLTQAQPDIVSTHGTRAAWYALRALRASAVRPYLVYNEHLFSFDARRGPLRWPWIAIERYICRRADALATSCAANAGWAESRGWIRPDRIAMRHYGIELEAVRDQAAHRVPREAFGIADSAPVIGSVGRLIPQKGLGYLLEAAAQLVTQVPNAQFLLVGEGELRPRLEEQCRRLGLTQHVRFLGAHSQPWRILANCDVIALPSTYEGLPQTGLEALAVGKPVVATRLNGTAEIIRSGYNGLLVPRRDARALADAILRLLRDPELRECLAASGPSSVAEYSAQIMIAKFDTMYKTLYAQRERGAAEEAAVPRRFGAD